MKTALITLITLITLQLSAQTRKVFNFTSTYKVFYDSSKTKDITKGKEKEYLHSDDVTTFIVDLNKKVLHQGVDNEKEKINYTESYCITNVEVKGSRYYIEICNLECSIVVNIIIEVDKYQEVTEVLSYNLSGDNTYHGFKYCNTDDMSTH